MILSTVSASENGVIRKSIPFVVSILGAFIALYSSNPSALTLPSRDSGVFLYIGWRWLNGDIPYKDVWDHKPPLIYMVDALGISLTPDSLWGVWLLQFIFLFITILFIYKALDQQFGILAALSGAIVLASGLVILLEKGNVTEEYALVFQATCLLLFVRAHRMDYPLRSTFWLGLCAGLALNFKQTTIGVWVAYVLILTIIRLRQRKFPVRDGLSFLTGFLLPTAVIITYFDSQNALIDFWEQAYLYNFIYIGKHDGIRSLIPVFTKGFLLLTRGGILYLIVVAWFAGLVYILLHRKETTNPLVWLALLALPIEVVLITTSRRSIIHYYLTMLPVASILIGSMVHTIPRSLAKLHIPTPRLQALIPSVLLVTVLLLQLDHVRNYTPQVPGLRFNQHTAVIEYVVQNTNKDDMVLIIGAESLINFLARREAPTRYVYQYPLQLLGRRPMFEEYFNQILENKPVLIIDTRGRNAITEKLYEPLQKRSEIVRDGVRYLGENYEQVAQFGEWFVYRLNP